MCHIETLNILEIIYNKKYKNPKKIFKKLCKCKICLKGCKQDRGNGQDNWPILVQKNFISYQNEINFCCKTNYTNMSQKANSE